MAYAFMSLRTPVVKVANVTAVCRAEKPVLPAREYLPPEAAKELEVSRRWRFGGLNLAVSWVSSGDTERSLGLHLDVLLGPHPRSGAALLARWDEAGRWSKQRNDSGIGVSAAAAVQER